MATLLKETILDNIDAYSHSNWYKMKIEVWLNSQSIDENKDNITVKRFFATKTNSAGWYSHSSPKITSYHSINSASWVTESYTNIKNLPQNNANNWIQFGSWTGDVFHKTDGTQIFNAKATLSGTSSSYSYLSKGATVTSGNFDLPTIPRASQPTLSNSSVNIGENLIINTNRLSTSFIHTIRVEFGSWSKELATDVTDTYNWDTSEDGNELYAQIPNTNTGTGIIYVDTYIAGVLVGTKSVNFTGKVINSNPIFNDFLYQDTNSNIVAITGNNQLLVKNHSNIKVTISSANKMVSLNGATPKNYGAVIDNRSVNENYSTSNVLIDLGTIQSAGTKKLTVRAYDSRNNSTPIEKDVTIYDYSPPVIYATLQRLNDFEIQTTLSVNGTYTPLNIGGINKNVIVSNGVQYRYREIGENWGAWNNLSYTTDPTNGTFECSNITLNLDNSKSFQFEIKCTDNIETSILNDTTTIVDIGIPPFFVSSNKKAIGVNCIPPSSATEGSIYYKKEMGDIKEVLDYDVVDTW